MGPAKMSQSSRLGVTVNTAVAMALGSSLGSVLLLRIHKDSVETSLRDASLFLCRVPSFHRPLHTGGALGMHKPH